MINEFVQYRKLTDEEFGRFIKFNRTEKNITQEKLAELSCLEVRTISRVENGRSGDSGTRCALAKALGFDDVCRFNKPVPMLDSEKIKKHEEKIKQETIKIEINKVLLGVDLREFSECCEAAQFTFLDKEASKNAIFTFARIEDYIKDYMDIHADLTAQDKLGVDADLEEYIQSLFEIGCSVGVGKTFAILKDTNGGAPVKLPVMYCVASLEKDFPSMVRVAKDTKLTLC